VISRVSGAEPFVVSRVRPSHLTPPLRVRGWRDTAFLLPFGCPLSRRWLPRLLLYVLLRLLLHRYHRRLPAASCTPAATPEW